MSDRKPFTQKPNTGSLFVNKRKETDRHPDFTGTINVDGRLYWLNCWERDDSGDGPVFSLSVRPKTTERPAGPTSPSGGVTPPQEAEGEQPGRGVPF